MALSTLRMSGKLSASLTSAAAACLAVLACGSAQAASTYDASTGILRIIGTGEGLTPVSGSSPITDPNWQVTAFPTSGSFPSPAITTPRPVYIPGTTPPSWYDGNPPSGNNTANNPVSGVGFDSGSTYRWATVLGTGTGESPFNTGEVPGNNAYSYVVSTDFTVTQAGIYTFNSNMSGDNRIAVYLGGTPTATTPPYSGLNSATNPFGYTISGGQLLAASSTGPATLTSTVGPKVFLNPGNYALNYLITDFYTAGQANSYGGTGLLVSTSYFERSVPGPLPLLGAGAFFAHSRRLRRRVKAGQVAAS